MVFPRVFYFVVITSPHGANGLRLIRFQVSDKQKIDEISEAFATFDRNASGTISSDEFQNICFEIGEILTEEQVAQAVAEIDLDGSGAITFTEFAIWWLCAEREADTVAGARLRMLQAKLRMRKRIRKMAVSTKMATHALALSALAGASTARRRVVTAANTVRSHGRNLGNIASSAVDARRAAFKSAAVRRTPSARTLAALVSPAALFRSKLRARRAKRRLAGKLKQRALEAEAERLEQGKRNLKARLAEQEQLKLAKEAKEKAELEQFRMAAINKAREQAAAKEAKEKAQLEHARMEEAEKAAKKAAYLEQIANERIPEKDEREDDDAATKLSEEIARKRNLAARREKQLAIQKRMEEKFAALKKADAGQGREAMKEKRKREAEERAKRMKMARR